MTRFPPTNAPSVVPSAAEGSVPTQHNSNSPRRGHTTNTRPSTNAGGLRGAQPPEGTGGRVPYSGAGQGPLGTAPCHTLRAKASPMARYTVSLGATPHPLVCSHNPPPDNPLARSSLFLLPSSSQQRPPSLNGGHNAGETELASGTHRERPARVTPTNRGDAPSLCGWGSLTCEVRPQLPARPTASRGFSRPVRPAIETPQPIGLLATAIAPFGRRRTITRTGPQRARTLYPHRANPSTYPATNRSEPSTAPSGAPPGGRTPLIGWRGGVGHCIDPLPAIERVPNGPAHPLGVEPPTRLAHD